MPSRGRPGARPAAAPLATSLLTVAIALSGCSGSSSSPTAAAPSPRPSANSGTTAPPKVDTQAAKAIDRAARVMSRVRSYRFVADERVAATTRLRSHLTGSLVRGQGIAYRLTVGSTTRQVVQLRTATYTRVVPHRWSRRRHQARLVNPTSTLQLILHGLQPTGLATSHGITAVHGVLAAASARGAGLPANKPAQVTVTIDAAGRVVAIQLSTSTRAAGHAVTVHLRTSYSDFDKVRPIRKPV